jgi:hypothetical protein
MSLGEIMQFILLPALGWTLLNFYKLDHRLTRIEAKLEILLPNYSKSETKPKKYELRSTQLVSPDRP